MPGAGSIDLEGANDSPKAARSVSCPAGGGATLPKSGDAAPTPRGREPARPAKMRAEQRRTNRANLLDRGICNLRWEGRAGAGPDARNNLRTGLVGGSATNN